MKTYMYTAICTFNNDRMKQIDIESVEEMHTIDIYCEIEMHIPYYLEVIIESDCDGHSEDYIFKNGLKRISIKENFRTKL
jgi:hypothetical protein